MRPRTIIIALLSGLAGAIIDGGSGFLFGVTIGYLLEMQVRVRAELSSVQSRLTVLSEMMRRAQAPSTEPSAGGETAVDPVVSERDAPRTRPQDAERVPTEPLSAQDRTNEVAPSVSSTRPGKASSSLPPENRAGAAQWLEGLRQLVFGGNTLVRLGVIVLFIGLAFLTKLAVDHDYFPLELRLASTAAAGIALCTVGWRLRRRRPDVSLALQGGGVAVLYLTTFATYQLYSLMAATPAFGLLVLLTVACATLAILQNAQSLAFLALIGGIFAPLLTASDAGSHVALFSYYGVLNLGVLLLAWYRWWRPLNLLAFVLTFTVFGGWISLEYDSSMYGSAQPFLALFFLTYLGISFFHARHRLPRPKDVVDGTFVFGLPVVVFSIQATLVQEIHYGLAWSALILGGFYAAVASLVYQRAPELLRLMAESFAAIALVLVTMVLPFALDATWTGTGWALEGAALVWLAARQGRSLLYYGGLALQVAAGVSFLSGSMGAGADAFPILHSVYFGYLSLAAGALFTSFVVSRSESQFRLKRVTEAVFLVLAMFWWFAGGAGEIARLAEGSISNQSMLLFSTATAVALLVLARRLEWTTLSYLPLLLLPALFLLLAAAVDVSDHPFAAFGGIAWPVAVAGYYLVLRKQFVRLPAVFEDLLHAGTVWFVALLVAWQASWALGRVAESGTAWLVIAWGVIPSVATIALLKMSRTNRWPFAEHRRAYDLLAPPALLLAFWIWSMSAAMLSDGNPAPLPYLPLLNPVDVALGLGVVAAVKWALTAEQHLALDTARLLRRVVSWLAATSAFIWANALLARTVHHWADVPYQLLPLISSTLFQMSMTILWTAIAVTAMAWSARRGGRVVWIAAAVLLAAAVVKLFLVDLSSIGSVARIVTFIVVGLLLLLVGYLAPVPPAAKPRESATPVPG